METSEYVPSYPFLSNSQYVLSIRSKHSILPGDGDKTPENIDLCFQQEIKSTDFNTSKQTFLTFSI